MTDAHFTGTYRIKAILYSAQINICLSSMAACRLNTNCVALMATFLVNESSIYARSLYMAMQTTLGFYVSIQTTLMKSVCDVWLLTLWANRPPSGSQFTHV